MKIDFEKLLNDEYPLNIQMEVINWFLKTGNKYDAYSGKWNKDGVNKQIFNYSANSHNSNFPFPLTKNNFIGNKSHSFNIIRGFVSNCLFNAIVKNPTKPVAQWREAENIKIGKYRMLNLNNDKPEIIHQKCSNYYFGILNLFDLNNTPLKKELFHPSHTERINPKITNVILYTNGDGYVFEYEFSFSNINYESSWSNYITQKENESLISFMNRVFYEIDTITDIVF